MREDAAREVEVLAAWHLPSTWRLPAAFWRVRLLERRSRDAAGLRWMHRWLSRRSLLLTSTWASEEEARAWLVSATFRETDERLRAAGAEARIEVTRRLGDPADARYPKRPVT